MLLLGRDLLEHVPQVDTLALTIMVSDLVDDYSCKDGYGYGSVDEGLYYGWPTGRRSYCG